MLFNYIHSILYYLRSYTSILHSYTKLEGLQPPFTTKVCSTYTVIGAQAISVSKLLGSPHAVPPIAVRSRVASMVFLHNFDLLDQSYSL